VRLSFWGGWSGEVGGLLIQVGYVICGARIGSKGGFFLFWEALSKACLGMLDTRETYCLMFGGSFDVE